MRRGGEKVKRSVRAGAEINFCLEAGTGIHFLKLSDYSHVKICQTFAGQALRYLFNLDDLP